MRCHKCGKSVSGKSYGTPLGERVCGPCNDKVNGFVIGALAGDAGGAVAGPGIMAWVRTSLRGKAKRSTI